MNCIPRIYMTTPYNVSILCIYLLTSLYIYPLFFSSNCSVFKQISHGNISSVEAMALTNLFVNVFFWALILRIGAAREPCSSSIADEKPTVILKTIHIQTSVLCNTTIPVDADLTLTVDNAPTHVDLITTYFSNPVISR